MRRMRSELMREVLVVDAGETLREIWRKWFVALMVAAEGIVSQLIASYGSFYGICTQQ